MERDPNKYSLWTLPAELRSNPLEDLDDVTEEEVMELLANVSADCVAEIEKRLEPFRTRVTHKTMQTEIRCTKNRGK